MLRYLVIPRQKVTKQQAEILLLPITSNAPQHEGVGHQSSSFSSAEYRKEHD